MWSRIPPFIIVVQVLGFLCCCLGGYFEHVVLADCYANTPNITHLSHMAYYSSTLRNSPDAVTVIPTRMNTTVPWFNTTNNATRLSYIAVFPDGTVFNLTLTNRSSIENTLGGVGNNGWGTFKCWRYAATGLYSWYSNVWCDAVYDCNHQDRGGDQSLPTSTSSSATPSRSEPSSSSSVSTSSSSSPAPSSTGASADGGVEHRDATRSDSIALGLGLGIGLPGTVAALVGLWYANRQWNLARVLHLHPKPTMNERPSSVMEMNEVRGVVESNRASGDDGMVLGDDSVRHENHHQYLAR